MVSLRVSLLGKMSLFLAVRVSFRVAREEITKKERILIRYIYSFRGLHNVRPHPDRSLLGVKFNWSLVQWQLLKYRRSKNHMRKSGDVKGTFPYLPRKASVSFYAKVKKFAQYPSNTRYIVLRADSSP